MEPQVGNVGNHDVVIVATDSNNDVTNHEFTITVHALPRVSIIATNSEGNELANVICQYGPITLKFINSETTTPITENHINVTNGSLSNFSIPIGIRHYTNARAGSHIFNSHLWWNKYHYFTTC